MYFVVYVAGQEPVLVEAESEQQAVLETPNAVSARIAQVRDIEQLQDAQATVKRINL